LSVIVAVLDDDRLVWVVMMGRGHDFIINRMPVLMDDYRIGIRCIRYRNAERSERKDKSPHRSLL
jgi:hypothetical protein